MDSCLPTSAKTGQMWGTRRLMKGAGRKCRSFNSRLNGLLRPKSGRNEFGRLA